MADSALKANKAASRRWSKEAKVGEGTYATVFVALSWLVEFNPPSSSFIMVTQASVVSQDMQR